MLAAVPMAETSCLSRVRAVAGAVTSEATASARFCYAASSILLLLSLQDQG
jgi:hypothetical protein